MPQHGLLQVIHVAKPTRSPSFQRLLGFPDQPPDYSMVRQFRERLAATKTAELAWKELQRQPDRSGDLTNQGNGY